MPRWIRQVISVLGLLPVLGVILITSKNHLLRKSGDTTPIVTAALAR